LKGSVTAARIDTPTVLGKAAWKAWSHGGATVASAGSSAGSPDARRNRARGSFETRDGAQHKPQRPDEQQPEPDRLDQHCPSVKRHY
jgi:hypothetical protein